MNVFWQHMRNVKFSRSEAHLINLLLERPRKTKFLMALLKITRDALRVTKNRANEKIEPYYEIVLYQEGAEEAEWRLEERT